MKWRMKAWKWNEIMAALNSNINGVMSMAMAISVMILK